MMRSDGSFAATTQAPGPFLHGWGGVISVLSGMLLGAAVAAAVSRILGGVDELLLTAGASALARFWTYMAFIATGWVVILVPDALTPGSRRRRERMRLLRQGVGGWGDVRAETLDTCIWLVFLWLLISPPPSLAAVFDSTMDTMVVPLLVLVFLLPAVGYSVREVVKRRRHHKAAGQPS